MLSFTQEIVVWIGKPAIRAKKEGNNIAIFIQLGDLDDKRKKSLTYNKTTVLLAFLYMYIYKSIDCCFKCIIQFLFQCNYDGNIPISEWHLICKIFFPSKMREVSEIQNTKGWLIFLISKMNWKYKKELL